MKVLACRSRSKANAIKEVFFVRFKALFREGCQNEKGGQR